MRNVGRNNQIKMNFQYYEQNCKIDFNNLE